MEKEKVFRLWFLLCLVAGVVWRGGGSRLGLWEPAGLPLFLNVVSAVALIISVYLTVANKLHLVKHVIFALQMYQVVWMLWQTEVLNDDYRLDLGAFYASQAVQLCAFGNFSMLLEAFPEYRKPNTFFFATMYFIGVLYRAVGFDLKKLQDHKWPTLAFTVVSVYLGSSIFVCAERLRVAKETYDRGMICEYKFVEKAKDKLEEISEILNSIDQGMVLLKNKEVIYNNSEFDILKSNLNPRQDATIHNTELLQ